MRALAALTLLVGVLAGPTTVGADQSRYPVDPPLPEVSFLTIHNLRPAHELTVGVGARVGILDHSFEMDTHPDLYAGGARFWEGAGSKPGEGADFRGFWMARTVKEIAPGAAVFALEIPRADEQARVEAIIRALDWAVNHELDVVAYCGDAFSEAAQITLDPVLERTVKAGVVVTFVGYPNPHNLLPGGFGPSAPNGTRGPDLNIFSDDCTSLLADRFQALVETDDDTVRLHRPFLARSATGSITAGLVALVRSANPAATPEEVKNILVETSRPVVFRGRRADRVPDAYSAVSRAVGTAR
jgi:subtilisin family serine protease